MTELTQEEVKSLIERIGLRGYEFQYKISSVINNIWIVHQVGRNIFCLTHEKISFVWKKPDNPGTIHDLTIYNAWVDFNGRIRYGVSRSHEGYIRVFSSRVENKVLVKFGSGDSYKGDPWTSTMKIATWL